MNYTHFSKYVLRSPLLPIKFFFNLTKGEAIPLDELRNICSDPIIKEALFLASPTFYETFEKCLLDSQSSPETNEKIAISVLKYLSRMSSRCTPFGLFAGTAVGHFDTHTDIKRRSILNNKRHTRLDMNYVVALSQNIIKDKQIASSLSFFPNSSLYKIGEQWRYVEYHYENSIRIHHITGVAQTEYLNKVLVAAQEGATIETLARILINEDITYEAADTFINELIENQLLVSDLEPTVSGKIYEEQLISILKNHNHTQRFTEVLEKVQRSIKNVDRNIGNDCVVYKNIALELDRLGTVYDMKYLFQADMVVQTMVNTLDQKWLYKAKRAIRFLNKITLKPNNTLLHEFVDAFKERYETREVPLATALDVELGIGFLQNGGTGDVNDLLDDLILPSQSTKKEKRISLNTVHQRLFTLLQECLVSRDEVLTLHDNSFKDLVENWDDLPDTISSMVKIVNTGEGEQLVLSNCGGTSAANLLGRFAYGEPEMRSHVQEIAKTEKKCHPDALLAEIVHLPEARAGNILMRPHLRDFEIPYLAKSSLDSKMQLPLEDLMISVRADKVYLRSKKYNKEVIPYLSNAHNYSNGALPIYQLLANLQGQGTRRSLYFDWGSYAADYIFLPRVTYKDVILSEKTWNFKKEHIQELKGVYSNKGALKDFIKKYRLPKYILLIEGDNELLVNLENQLSLKMLISILEKKTICTLKEFLHLDDGVVTDGKATYTNQFIFSLYNKDKASCNG